MEVVTWCPNPCGGPILTPAGGPILTPAGGKVVRVIAADKILADFDLGYGGPCGHLHNLSPKSYLGFYRC